MVLRRIPAVAFALVGAAVASPAASAAVSKPPVVLPAPQAVGDFKALTDVADYMPQRYTERGLLRPDGALAWVNDRHYWPDQPQGLTLTSVTPFDASPVWTNSLVPESSDLEATFVDYPVASAIGGSDWVVAEAVGARSTPSAMPFAPPFLVALDDRGHITKRTPLPSVPRSSAVSVVPTVKGIRVVMQPRDQDFHADRAPLIVDGRGRLLQRIRQLTHVTAVAATSSGDLYISGFPSAATSDFPLILVRPNGRTSIVRNPQLLDDRGMNGLAPYRDGVLEIDGDGADRPNSISYLRGDRVILSRRVRSLSFTHSPKCLAAPHHFDALTSVMVGSAGTPVVTVTCSKPGDRGPDQLGQTFLGLDRHLRVRWQLDLPGRDGGPGLVGPDARLLEIADEQLVAVREPSTLPIVRGVATSVRRDADGSAVVTIVCRRQFGAICNGIVEVRSGAAVVGTARYIAPGRPGALASVIERHVPIEGARPGQLSVQLRALG